jgi:hypothetical protein
MDITTAHQLLGYASLATTIALLGAAAWSSVAVRRTSGAHDHRFAVDRLILGVVAIVAIAGLVGLWLVAGGQLPADPLHLVYGPAALLTAPIGYALATRRDSASAHGGRRDAWIAVAAVVLLGIELRLLVTG